jgi:hypothetical protein
MKLAIALLTFLSLSSAAYGQIEYHGGIPVYTRSYTPPREVVVTTTFVARGSHYPYYAPSYGYQAYPIASLPPTVQERITGRQVAVFTHDRDVRCAMENAVRNAGGIITKNPDIRISIVGESIQTDCRTGRIFKITISIEERIEQIREDGKKIVSNVLVFTGEGGVPHDSRISPAYRPTVMLQALSYAITDLH